MSRVAVPRNRYDLSEWAGAFGDLGTLIPFVAAYIAVLGMDPGGMLLAFGVALIAVGAIYRTPFPVQPMKAVGAASVGQAALASGLTGAAVVGATLCTGLIWLLLAATGWAQRLGRWVPRSALLGVVMGLGFSFMLEGLQRMAASPWLAAALLGGTLLLLGRARLPAMLILLALGALIACVQQPALLGELSALRPGFRLPAFSWGSLTAADLWTGLVVLALPQLPLTFGNAYLSVTEENNRLFPDRPVTQRAVALSTGLMNVGASAVGGIPMCHGAGGMAGHVQFGARTGGSSIILGGVLLAAGLFFADSIGTLFRLFPPAVLGVILFLAGVQLALGSRDSGTEKADRFVLLATAAIAIVNVGLAVLFGIAAHHAARQGWMRL
ncbi:MAG: putative sulfate/molybdate transporter [Hylemonella sp.]|uniref:putative sulfate/molybdate transporter n=1 Tax=Hylemonella sp. TaxID=2066020 RepID=UPI0022C56E1D|nr:putative sulfate/molybdate transporter [Hylemonella sp.]MCZ8250932.1 putative sulfate/molybdate transporter [Hylemonella sp.]